MCIGPTARFLVTMMGGIGRCGSYPCLDAWIPPKCSMRSKSARWPTQMPIFGVWPSTANTSASAWLLSFKSPPESQSKLSDFSLCCRIRRARRGGKIRWSLWHVWVLKSVYLINFWVVLEVRDGPLLFLAFFLVCRLCLINSLSTVDWCGVF